MDTSNSIKLVLHHYYRTKPFNCLLRSGDLENFFTVSICDLITTEGMIKGDPIIYARLSEDNEVQIKGGIILATNTKDNSIIIAPDKDYTGEERRESERFPTSLLGYLKYGNGYESNEHAYIKDMSYSGFRIYTNSEMNIYDRCELEVNFPDNVFKVEGVIARKAANYGRYEYGFQIVYLTKGSIEGIKVYIESVLRYEKNLLFKYIAKQDF